MRESSVESSGFPLASCAACGKTVLTYVAFDAAEREYRACVHCDGAVEGVRWAPADEVETLGYDFGAPAGRGCSGGCSGCALGRE